MKHSTKHWILWLSALSFLGLAGGAARAQFPQPKILTLSAAAPASVTAGRSFTVVLTAAIQPGYHIQSNNPASGYIPTAVSLKLPKGYRAGSPLFPQPEMITVGPDHLPVFSGKVTINVPISAPKTAKGTGHATATVSFQGCNDQSCFPPTSVTATLSWNVQAAGASAVSSNRRQQSSNLATTSTKIPPAGTKSLKSASITPNPTKTAPANQKQTGATVTGSGNQTASGSHPPVAGAEVTPNGSTAAGGSVNNSFTARANRLAGKLLKGGNLLLILPVLFLVGLLLNLTPCVYPLIPITIGYFGGQAASNPGVKTIKLAVAYVIGMVVMYAGLGLFSSLAGAVFGSWLQIPWILAIFAAVMFALGLAMFERKNGQPIWEIRLPGFLTDKAQARSGTGGALVMGLLVGVVAAPCIGPAVVALINVVAIRHSVPFGLATFGALGLGLGVPYLVLGSSAPLLAKLPRSGEWMMAVKHIFGLVLFGVGIYYLNGIIQNDTVYRWLLAGYVALAGIYLNLWDMSGQSARRFFQFKRVLGLAAVAYAAWMMVPPPVAAPAAQIAWQPYNSQRVEDAEADGKPVMIDFGAKWCAKCNELDQETYTSPAVIQAASGIVTLKVNATDSNDPAVQAAEKRYRVVGLPAVIFIGPDGHERKDLSLFDFEPPSLFVKRLERLKVPNVALQ